MRRNRLLSTLVLLATALTSLGLRGALAGEYGTFLLRSKADVARWSGVVAAGNFSAGPVPVPEACSPAVCDVVSLLVSLRAGAWDTPGGMLVAIQWPEVDGAWDLDLFVYAPDGSLAAKSTVWLFSRNESVWIPNPVDGQYTIVVMPKTVVSQPVVPGVLTPLPYDGFVRFQDGVTFTRRQFLSGEPYDRTIIAFGDAAGADPPVAMLPDIVPTEPRKFHVESTAGGHYYFYMDRGVRHQPSCYAVETLGLTADEPTPGSGPQKCLRWEQGERNIGTGPLELNIYEGSTEAYQRLYRSDGTVEHNGPVGKVIFSQTHGHFHYVGWQEIKLHSLQADGSAGPVVRTGLDKGICMVDIENNRFGRRDVFVAPHGYPMPGSCDDFSQADPFDPTFPGRKFFQMGISVGHADIYPWFIADQYLDITGLPDGRYVMVVRQDAAGSILEADTTNNVTQGCVEIAGDSARDIPCA